MRRLLLATRSPQVRLCLLYTRHPQLTCAYASKLPASFLRSVGTTPVFYNRLKGEWFVDPSEIMEIVMFVFGHHYVLDILVPIWSFGRGLSYTTFN